MPSSTKLPETRLASLYDAAGFGGETTQRAKVIRELIDEIRLLRRQLEGRPSDASVPDRRSSEDTDHRRRP